MFTGLVQHIGTLEDRIAQPEGARIVVNLEGWDHRAERGESIAISGCCLTVVENEGPRLLFDAVETTLGLTTLGAIPTGSGVNLEHAATPTTLLGGHIVQGHVEGMGRVLSNREESDRGWILKVEVPDTVGGYLIEKGSITIDGVSLTVAELEGTVVEVALIPETLERTTLDRLGEGDPVNLESDCLARMVGKLLERGGMRSG